MARRRPSPTELPYLRTFCEAAEHCSFTAAGKSLGMTQAAISQRIHALEQSVGKPLFQRNGTRILLTAAGQQLYGYAQKILALHQEAIEALSGVQMPAHGELILGASSVPGEHFLPQALAAFGKTHPEIHTRATILDSAAVVRDVRQGHVHLGLVGRKVEEPRLESRPFASDEMVLAAPANHAWRRRKAVSFEHLASQPLVLREPGSGSRWCFEQALAASGKSVSELQVALELGSNEAVKKAVLAGMGVAVLSSKAIESEVAAGQLRPLNIEGVCLRRTMYVIWDARRAMPIPARLFLSFLDSWPQPCVAR